MAGTGAKDGNHDESFSEEQMLTGSHINHLWPKLMIEELVRCGATNFCISSGSRSAPLVLAAAENENVDSIIHTDERAAAFYAVGYAKASGNPAVLICTSGTALANYYPAIVEASFSGTPLLVLSSDRPVELRDSSAPQTIDQVKIFGSYLRWFFDLHSPDIVINPAFLLTTIDQAVYRARRTPPGPVQINCQFREPLAPPDGEQDFSEYLAPVKHWLDGKKPYTKYLPPETRPADDDLLEIAERIQSATKGMIVVGLLPVGSEKKSIIRLANRLGWPLLADIASGLRFAGIKASNVLCHYDLYLRVADFREKYRPDLILHFGGLPTAKSLCQYIEQSKAEYIVINNHPYRQDPSHLVTQRIEAEPAKLADDLFVKVQKGDSPLSEPFAVAERAAAAIVAELITGSDEISECAVARLVAELTAADSALFLANSMPIRDVDTLAPSRDVRLAVAANRGANGIDGTLATAVGFANGLHQPVILLLGDLALLHDLNSLALAAKSKLPITIVVVNNGGGGIFSFLPIAKVKAHFEEYFGTPHEYEFKSAAAMYDLPYHQAATPAQFTDVYRQAALSSKSVIIEIKSNRKRNFAQHEEIWRAIERQIKRELNLNITPRSKGN